MSAVIYVFDTLAAAWRILREQPRSGRTGLLLVFLKLRAKFLFGRYVRKEGLRRETICGFQVECFDYGSLVLLFEEVFLHKDYHFACNTERPLVLDCGSNIGMALLYFKRTYPGARVIGFEASRKAFEVLARNVTSNQLEDVELHNVALHSSEGEVAFYEDAQHPGCLKSSIDAARTAGDSRCVMAVPLSKFVEGPVDFLKMDIEGAEEGVLGELAQSGRLRFIRQLVVEYHHHIHPQRDTLAGVLRVLEENGFGYQIRAASDYPFARERLQDVLIYGYRK